MNHQVESLDQPCPDFKQEILTTSNAICYKTNNNNTPKVAPLITTSKFVFYYCNHIRYKICRKSHVLPTFLKIVNRNTKSCKGLPLVDEYNAEVTFYRQNCAT